MKKSQREERRTSEEQKEEEQRETDASTYFAVEKATGQLEEAYGFFLLHVDAVATDGPGGPNARQPLLSWQQRGQLAPSVRIATGAIGLPPQYRMGSGLEKTSQAMLASGK